MDFVILWEKWMFIRNESQDKISDWNENREFGRVMILTISD